MPGFASLAAADDWRAIHAPPRGRRLIGKNRVETTTTPSAGSQGAAPEGEGHGEESSPPNSIGERDTGGGSDRGREAEVINIRRFIRRTDDFDGLALNQAQGVLQVAHGLYLRACEGGNAVEISAALKNWTDAAKACGSARETFLATREKSRALISLDEVEDVVGTELQELRNALLKHGDRVAAALAQLGPAVGAQVKAAVDGDIDGVFKKLAALPVSTRRQLVAS